MASCVPLRIPILRRRTLHSRTSGIALRAARASFFATASRVWCALRGADGRRVCRGTASRALRTSRDIRPQGNLYPRPSPAMAPATPQRRCHSSAPPRVLLSPRTGTRKRPGTRALQGRRDTALSRGWSQWRCRVPCLKSPFRTVSLLWAPRSCGRRGRPWAVLPSSFCKRLRGA